MRSPATTLPAHAAALRAVAAQRRSRLELGAADGAVAIGVELREALRTAGAALLLTRAARFTALAATRLRNGAGFFLGDETVAVGIDAGEAGIDTLFHGGAGQRLGVAGALHRMRESGGGAEHRKRGTGKNELLHGELL